MCVTKPVRFRTTIPTFRRGGKATQSPSRRATLPLWRFCPQRGLRPVPPSARGGRTGTVRTGFLPTQTPQGRDGAGASELTGPPAQPERTGSAPSAAVSSGAGSYGVGTGRTVTFLPSFLVPDLPARAALGGTWPQGPERRQNQAAPRPASAVSHRGEEEPTRARPRPAPCPPGTPLQARAGRLSPARAPAPGRV